MKYLAILKDSLREARDSKVLLVLFILSTIAILFVATLGFKPMSAHETFQQFFDGRLELALNANNTTKIILKLQRPSSTMTLEKVELLKGDEDSPHSDYVLTVVYYGNVQHKSHGMVVETKEGVVIEKKEKKDGVIDEKKEKKASDAEGKQKEKIVAVVQDRAVSQKALEDLKEVFRDAVELELVKIDNPELLTSSENQLGRVRLRVTVHSTPRTPRIWASERRILFWAMPPMFGGAGPLGYMIFATAKLVMGFGTWVAVLLGVIITSSFIPSMLRKGTVDMLLVKPIHRSALLCYKYLGGLTFIFLITTYAVVGIWFVIGLRTGLWSIAVLIWIPGITFFFAILYAISTLMGVLTRSTITAILITCFAWFLFFGIGQVESFFQMIRGVEADEMARQKEAERMGIPAAKTGRSAPGGDEGGWGDGAFAKTVHVIHAITPRTSDLDRLSALSVYCGYVTGNLADLEKFDAGQTVWWESLLVSLAWIAIFLGVSCLWFSRTAY